MVDDGAGTSCNLRRTLSGTSATLGILFLVWSPIHSIERRLASPLAHCIAVLSCKILLQVQRTYNALVCHLSASQMSKEGRSASRNRRFQRVDNRNSESEDGSERSKVLPPARLTRVAAVMFHHEDRRKTMQRLEPGTRPRAPTTTTTARTTTDGATKSYKAV